MKICNLYNIGSVSVLPTGANIWNLFSTLRDFYPNLVCLRIELHSYAHCVYCAGNAKQANNSFRTAIE